MFYSKKSTIFLPELSSGTINTRDGLQITTPNTLYPSIPFMVVSSGCRDIFSTFDYYWNLVLSTVFSWYRNLQPFIHYSLSYIISN